MELRGKRRRNGEDFIQGTVSAPWFLGYVLRTTTSTDFIVPRTLRCFPDTPSFSILRFAIEEPQRWHAHRAEIGYRLAAIAMRFGHPLPDIS